MKTAIKYPNMNDYQEALQHPELKFKDHRLKSCNIEKDPMGMPKVRSGGFALTYKLVNSNKRWAVRCFHKPLADREKRYALISSYLNSKKSPILINVEYLPDEILVKGNRHPVTLMDWIDGDTLSQYLYKNAGKPSKLANLVGEFLFVVDELERLQIAHGDLSHLNIIIKNEKMILIDYDGLFVPTIQGWKSAELGNRNFQHPLRKSDHFDSNIDRFSEIVIYLALYGIALSPKLFNKYGAGAEGLLFKVNDFLKPHESPLLRDLEAIPELKQLVKQFRAICLTEIGNVPRLRDLLGERAILIPQATLSTLSSLEAQSSSIVFDTTNRGLLLEKEGEFITVVGRITNVYKGIAINQKPYVFINFGDFRQGCFTIVLWSEALTLLKDAGKTPDEYLFQWVSVTGTVTKYNGRFNTSPQIVLDSPADIQVMTKQDALEKLGYSNLRYDKQENKISAEDSSSPVTRGIASRNKDKLSQLYSNINVQPTNSQPASKSMRKAKNPSVSSAQPQVNTSSKSPQTNVEKKLDYLYSQGNIAPIQSNKPKTVQIKPPVQKSSMSSILISFLIFGAIGILAIVFFILLLAINVPQSQSTSTPKPQLVATLRDEPTLSVIYATAIEKNECMRWTQVKSVHEGKQICVYGSVINKKTIRTDNDSWFLIRFDIDTTTFYIISDKILQVKIGDCIIAESVINYDINKVPYMKVDEVVIEDNRCVN